MTRVVGMPLSSLAVSVTAWISRVSSRHISAVNALRFAGRFRVRTVMLCSVVLNTKGSGRVIVIENRFSLCD